MALNLIEVIPHTGFGAALFPYLNEADLESLKLSCKTLKGDVESYLSAKNTTAPSPPPLGLVRKNDRLYV